MRKIVVIFAISLITILLGTIIFLSTIGIKTNIFNNLINNKLNEINTKIKLNLNDVNFKLNISNFEFEVMTTDPAISINDKKIDFEFISFDLSIFDYLNNKNPITQISTETKQLNTDQLINFINEYEFNIARIFILNQIKQGKVKIFSDIIFDQNKPKQLDYFVNGYVNDAQINLPNNLKAKNIKFDFKIDRDAISFKGLELLFDKIFITSDEINVKKIGKEFEINGNLNTKKTKINLKNYFKIFNKNLGILDDKFINLSSVNRLSFKINNKLKINDLIIKSKLNFDKLFTKSSIQDYIYLKDGDALLNYSKNELNISLDSKFLFKNKEYNNNVSENLFKLNYKKKENSNAVVNIDLSNYKNKINYKEFEKFISFKNLSVPGQEIIFSSNNKIKFNLNKSNKIKNLDIKSRINTDNILIYYKSQRINKYFSNFKNQVKLSQSNFDIEYSENDIKISLKSKYSINDINENITLTVGKRYKNYFFDLDIDLDSAEIKIDELEYVKKKDLKSNLYLKGIYKNNKEITFNNFKFNEEKNSLLIRNLEIDKNDKIQNLDLVKINLINRFKKKNELEFKKINGNYYLTGSESDGARNIKKILDNSSKSIFSYFKNLNTYIYVDISKYFINEVSYLESVKGEIQVKNSKIFNSNLNAKLNSNKKFNLKIVTNKNKQKITNLDIEQPEPFINNFKFINGFKEGNLYYESSEYEGKTRTNLKIVDFKVQEVPVLAKLLTLASLQGIADLLTGEGIRFSDFEMDYERLGNTTTIKEMYAIGPAISLLMEGYIVKDNLTSLRGTLVPATTINKTISKIPMLGEILVGKKIGEGVFGVSFKIKGPPKKLKTTVNPIKTLTPRFITRTLEKISN